jgi:hypothetical protein
VSIWIIIGYRIITTICKHIVAQESLSCACVGVSIDESSDLGIIIPALEIIESSLFGISGFIHELSSAWQTVKTGTITGEQG